MYAPEVAPGAVIGEKYVVEELLGEGAYARVFAARHRDVESLRFAVKVLRAEHAAEPETLARFKREAAAAAVLASRHTVRVVDYGVHDGRSPYLVMEKVDGWTLGSLADDAGPLRPWFVARFARDLLAALHEAHELGFMHRDVKPENAFVVYPPGAERPIALLSDFGIAKAMDDSAVATRTSGSGILCTPTYAAPELLRGVPCPQSDVYAVGFVMLELLDGRLPWAGEPVSAILLRHVSEEVVELGEGVLASGLEHIVRRATAKPLEQRFASAWAMAEALDDWLRGAPVPPMPASRGREAVVGALAHPDTFQPPTLAEGRSPASSRHASAAETPGSGAALRPVVLVAAAIVLTLLAATALLLSVVKPPPPAAAEAATADAAEGPASAQPPERTPASAEGAERARPSLGVAPTGSHEPVGSDDTLQAAAEPTPAVDAPSAGDPASEEAAGEPIAESGAAAGSGPDTVDDTPEPEPTAAEATAGERSASHRRRTDRPAGDDEAARRASTTAASADDGPIPLTEAAADEDLAPTEPTNAEIERLLHSIH